MSATDTSEQAESDALRPIDDVNVRLRELPTEASQARLDAAADDTANNKIAQPRIEAVLTACKLTAQQLETLHQGFADSTDLDLTGYSRASAIWLLSGRLLSLLRALLVQIEAGICNEAIITGRAIHEGARVLLAFSVPEADDLVRVWLDDQGRHGYVKQGAARAAERSYEDELSEAMELAGLPPLTSSVEPTDALYDLMSRAAHNRRSSCIDSLYERGRTMPYGRHPSPIRRAAYTQWAASMTSEIVNVVGDGLRALYAHPKFFTEHIVPLRISLKAVCESAPLDEQAIRTAAGTSGG